MSSSGPVETELRQPFRRREKLRLSLHLQRNIPQPELLPTKIMENHLKTMDSHELARKLNVQGSKLPFLLLDCRPKTAFTGSHIRGAVHFPGTERLHRRRTASVLEFISGLGTRRKGCPMSPAALKLREVIVYDEGLSRLRVDDPTASNPTAFVIAHLIQENKQPIYLEGNTRRILVYMKLQIKILIVYEHPE